MVNTTANGSEKTKKHHQHTLNNPFIVTHDSFQHGLETENLTKKFYKGRTEKSFVFRLIFYIVHKVRMYGVKTDQKTFASLKN